MIQVSRRVDGADHIEVLRSSRESTERQAADDVLSEAIVTVSADPAVRQARAMTIAALGRLLGAAQAKGQVRADATTLDQRLLLAATGAAGQLEPLLDRVIGFDEIGQGLQDLADRTVRGRVVATV